MNKRYSQRRLAQRNSKGFTLIELLLYIGVASSVMFVTTLFLASLLEARIKNETISEVTQQGQRVLQVMTQTIRNAEGINVPAIGVSTTTLSVDVFEAPSDPIVFSVSEGVLQMSEGVSVAVNLTNSQVVVSNLTFEHRGQTDAPATIHMSFDIAHVNPEGRYEYDFERTFYGSASMRF